MKKIAEYKDIEELSRLRIMQQKDDWKELYPGKDKEFFNITKGYLEEHLNKDVFFFIKIFFHLLLLIYLLSFTYFPFNLSFL